ncbi:unnamed protein product [Tuber aestivum]|uniref:Uncharacterized protein n=1 Tax=Tuber aestivum TaxID=59557 RepID=A0A292Q099_9PEZI|nr:unnamed protein product [Tuber aestivum]
MPPPLIFPFIRTGVALLPLGRANTSPTNLRSRSLRVIPRVDIVSVFDHNYHYPKIPVELSGPGKQMEMASYVLRHVHKLYGLPFTDESLVDVPKIPLALLSPSRAVRSTSSFSWASSEMTRANGPRTRTAWVVNTFKRTVDICGNCAGQEEADQLFSGGVDITNALYNKLDGAGSILDHKGEMETCLAENLRWKDSEGKPPPGALWLCCPRLLTGIFGKMTKPNIRLFVGVKSFVLLYPTDEFPIDGEEFWSTPKIVD